MLAPLQGVDAMDHFKPDCIIALGGGSPMDAAKIMRLMYEHPEQDFAGLYARFMDIRKRIVHFPEHGTLVKKLVSAAPMLLYEHSIYYVSIYLFI